MSEITRQKTAADDPACTIDFESRGCRKILQRNPSLEERIRDTLRRQISQGFTRTKAASRLKWNGLTVYEIRVNDPSVKAVRVAFTAQGSSIHVLFISTSIQKNEFSREIDSFLKSGS